MKLEEDPKEILNDYILSVDVRKLLLLLKGSDKRDVLLIEGGVAKTIEGEIEIPAEEAS